MSKLAPQRPPAPPKLVLQLRSLRWQHGEAAHTRQLPYKPRWSSPGRSWGKIPCNQPGQRSGSQSRSPGGESSDIKPRWAAWHHFLPSQENETKCPDYECRPPRLLAVHLEDFQQDKNLSEIIFKTKNNTHSPQVPPVLFNYPHGWSYFFSNF